jgi:hypothetical protein
MLNMDMSALVGIQASEHTWQSSPREGVWRKPLAREDAERGHATSIVRFDASSQFTQHGHPLGEEVLVLDGVFSDHTGDFDRGSYFRNPPGFDHAPFSTDGCTIFVKLHQFLPGDKERVCHNYLRSDETEQWRDLGDSLSFRLHHFESETVSLVRSLAKEVRFENSREGTEVYVLEGGVDYAGVSYNTGAWLRIPKTSTEPLVLASHSLLWLKTGHL